MELSLKYRNKEIKKGNKILILILALLTFKNIESKYKNILDIFLVKSPQDNFWV